jgi:hypothetical protein
VRADGLAVEPAIDTLGGERFARRGDGPRHPMGSRRRMVCVAAEAGRWRIGPARPDDRPAGNDPDRPSAPQPPPGDRFRTTDGAVRTR